MTLIDKALVAETSASDTTSFSSPKGHALARTILKDCYLISYVPHEGQIHGVCKALDGVDILAITPNRGGKTGYFTMYMHVVLALVKNPGFWPTAKFPKNHV